MIPEEKNECRKPFRMFDELDRAFSTSFIKEINHYPHRSTPKVSFSQTVTMI